MPAIAVAAVYAAGGLAAAKISSNASKHAADVQQKSNTDALTFEKQRDAEDRAQFDATQRANYDQYLTKYNAARALGSEYNFNLPEAKPYVPVAYAGQPGQGQPAPNGQPDPAAFIRQYQQTHSPTEGPSGILNAMKAAGYNVAPYMYGNTPSGNEISLNGEKYKVIGAEGGPNAYWYQAGMNDGAPQARTAAPIANPIGSYLQATLQQPQQPQDFKLRSINAFL